MSSVSMIDGHIDEQVNNCHGCKWLDENKSQGRGNGYCCHVVRSKTQSEKVRRPEMSRCELYKAGDFATRWETERENNA